MRIVIADAQRCVRRALRVLLQQQAGLQIVGEAANGQELLSRAQVTAPDLLLVAWELPGLAEIGGLPTLRDPASAAQIVVLSGRPDVREAAQVAGADAFVSKGDPPEGLLATIRRCGPAVTKLDSAGR